MQRGASAPPGDHGRCRIGLVCIGLVALWAGLLAVRLLAPDDLMDDDQQRPATYVLDCLDNDRWAIQYDAGGDLASKPPLAIWISALAARVWGYNRFTLVLPSALAVLAVAVMLDRAARTLWGPRVAPLVACAWLATQTAWKALGLVRTDPVFTAWICGGALLCMRACRNGRGWLWAFLCAAGAALTKGPLGLVLILVGLPACWWCRREGTTRLRGTGLTLGVVCLLVIVAAWFWSAVQRGGYAVVEKMIYEELLGHALRGDAGEPFGSGAWKPPLFLAARLLPWTPLAVWGIWDTLRRPADDPGRRFSERFLLCWAGLGLLLFALAGHQRNLLILPLVPPCLLLAARPLAVPIARRSPRWMAAACGLVGAGALLGCHIYYARCRAGHPQVVNTATAYRLADGLTRDPGIDAPLSYGIAPLAVSCRHGRYRRLFVQSIALELLRSDAAVWIVTRRPDLLRAALRGEGAAAHVLRREGAGDESVGVIANRPDFRPSRDTIHYASTFAVETRNLPLLTVKDGELRCARPSNASRVYLSNSVLSDSPRRFELIVPGRRRRITLAPGAACYLTWTSEGWRRVPHDDFHGPWRVDVRRMLTAYPIAIGDDR